MKENQKPRDYLFDNYKALLIFLVVAGHFIGPSAKDNSFLYALKWIIVSFHMPAFIFVSGYFSKRTPSFRSLVQKLAIPYIVYEAIYYVLYTFVLHKETTLALLRPKFTLWYLMTLFFWRIVTPYVKKLPVRVYLPLTVAAGLLIGCSGMPDNFLSIPRMLVFYPFFLAGTLLERDQLTKLRTKKGQRIAAAVLLAVSVLIVVAGLGSKLSMTVFFGRYNYAYLKQEMIPGMLVRLICYAVSFAMTLTLLLVLPEKRLCFSYIGTRTMAVYLFHGLLFKTLEHFGLLSFGDTIPGTIALLALCAAVTWVFSLPVFTKFTDKISSLI